MSLWRLEWLRLTRTRRLLAIVSVYVFFGLTGPLSVRYLPQILGRLGTQGVKVEFPEPTPADGIAQFASNTAQLGLLAVVLVAGSALAFDARRDMAVFLRTRVSHPRDILGPAYVVNAAAAVAALILGSAAAWYETEVLLGPLPAARMLGGMAYGALFLVFAVAVVALAASVVRSTIGAAGCALGVLLLMAIVGGLNAELNRWLPTHLPAALAGLVRDVAPDEYLPAAAVAVVLAAASLIVGAARTERREL